MNMNEIKNIKEFIKNNKDKRIIVVGTTCTGKTTLLKEINNAEDMDNLIFPKLTKKEIDYVCNTPWTEEIGKTMIKLVKEKIKVEKEKPLFGTVVLDCDLIIYLNISNELLKERTIKRKAKFKDAKNMQNQILNEIKESKILCVRYKVI